MTATDIRYGRRGGGWLPRPPTLPAEDQPPQRRQAITDPAILFHPDTIARSRAHDRTPSCPAHGRGDTDCTCRPDPDDLDEIWAGRARMARARRAAGQPLDTVDHQALTRAGLA